MHLLEVNIQWGSVGKVIGIFAAIALVLALLILLIAKLCRVKTDALAEQIASHLAGANCGGCGCSGCAAFAEKLARGEANLSDCHVTDREGKEEICALLGTSAAASVPTVMVLCCNGGDNAKDAFTYNGLPTCGGRQSLGGSKVCSYGCLGGGTCAEVCPQGAISMREGRSSIDPDLCISCGVCAANCPRSVLKRIPVTAPVYVACSSACRGKDVMNACTAGCIACGLCAKNCPAGAITMVDNLPVIDYTKCTGCKTCVAKCPRKVILDRTAQ